MPSPFGRVVNAIRKKKPAAKKSAKPARKRYPSTPGVDRRRRSDNPRTGNRYVSAAAKLSIYDTIGPLSLDAATIAKRCGKSLTLVHVVVKNDPGILVDQKATAAPREVDRNGRTTLGPKAVKYRLSKVALRHYDERQRDRLLKMDEQVMSHVSSFSPRSSRAIEHDSVHGQSGLGVSPDTEHGTHDSALETAPAVLQ